MSQGLVNLRLTLAVTLVFFVSCANCQHTYDFIVVGAGAGGCAVARRLAENGRYHVLLIESGGMPPDGHDIPVRAPEFLANPEMTFQFNSTRQRNAALRNNGIVSIVAGRMLGGTTSVNYMWFNRGHPRDWDNWAKVTGDDSWKYANMLKYFKRSENYRGDFPSDQHGYDGPITVGRPRYSPGLNFWLAAGKELGYPLGDNNGPQQRSFSPVEFAKRFGRRVSSFAGYVRPVLKVTNLEILANTNVTQVVFRGNRAAGVRVVSRDSRLSSVIYATKEVILGAGAFNSPVILQRSGIGPRDVLESAKIPIIKELPTGRNYQDHAAISLNFIINNASVVMNETRDLTAESWQLFNYFGDGPYSNTRGSSGQAMMSSSVAAAEGNFEWPDIQLLMSHSTLPFLAADVLFETASANVRPGEAPMSSLVYLGRPKSRGSVQVNPDNVLGPPLIDVGFLVDPRDLQMFLDGVRETLRIYEQTKAYGQLRPRYSPVTLPACDQFAVKSNEYWICYIGQTLQGGCHPAGTNKMGRVSDPTAVVDSELRVIGVDGLRVADASIMPFIVNSNPHAAVYGIAEKAAEMILNSWGTSPPHGYTRGDRTPHMNKHGEHRTPYINTHGQHRIPYAYNHGERTPYTPNAYDYHYPDNQEDHSSHNNNNNNDQKSLYRLWQEFLRRSSKYY